MAAEESHSSMTAAGFDEVTQSLIPEHIPDGVLIPLKTTLEIPDEHYTAQAMITRVPVKSAASVIALVFKLYSVLFHGDI
jgi:tRNA-specific adenosine deaminase 3